jgi:hypothetical protein
MFDQSQKEATVRGGDGPGEISGLFVSFIVPGAGLLGRYRNVAAAEATHANVQYSRDGEFHKQTVSISEARALMEQASRDQAAYLARRQAQGEAAAAEDEEARRRLAELACPICGCGQFDEETSRQDSQWGVTSFRMKLLICRRCAYVLHFALGRSLFDPG